MYWLKQGLSDLLLVAAICKISSLFMINSRSFCIHKNVQYIRCYIRHTDSEIKLVLSLAGLDASQQHFKSLKPILLHGSVGSVSSSDTSKYRCNCDFVSSEFSDLNVSASWLSCFLFFLTCSLSSNVFTCFLDSMIIFSPLNQK